MQSANVQADYTSRGCEKHGIATAHESSCTGSPEAWLSTLALDTAATSQHSASQRAACQSSLATVSLRTDTRAVDLSVYQCGRHPRAAPVQPFYVHSWANPLATRLCRYRRLLFSGPSNSSKSCPAERVSSATWPPPLCGGACCVHVAPHRLVSAYCLGLRRASTRTRAEPLTIGP